MADPDASQPLRLEVAPEPLPAEITREFRSALLANPVVRSHFPNADLWLVALDFLHKVELEEDDENLPFHAVLADMAGSVVVEADGYLWELDRVEARPTPRPRLPNDEEHAWAADLVRRDKALAARIDAGEAELYRPTPPLASARDADGSVLRKVTVGVRETAPDGTVTHRTLAVSSSDGEVTEVSPPSHEEGGLPPGTPAPPGPPAPQPPATGDRSQARVRVWRGEDLLWDLVVVRPQASSGANGSGVELRAVDFLGVRVLHRANVPIANVAFEDGQASRNWLNEESPFEAPADADADADASVDPDPVAGFRVCTAPPCTILQRGEGGGDYRGVALHLDGDDLVIVSQLEAGWYRYVSEWRLNADGTIRPRLGFGAVRNPRTHLPHTHHAYLRLDFDIVTPHSNQVQEHNEPTLPGQLAPWHTIRWEVSRRRDPAHGREWRVRSVRTPHGYAVLPGSHDGTADAFGAGDVWVLAQHSDELDDGEGVTADPARARAGLDRFVSNELVEREDVVVWYALHVPAATAAAEARIGPDLQPFMWRKVEKSTYVPLAPPPTLGPQDDDDDDDDDDEDDE
ncbi:MAG: hypothetical protein ACRD2W_04475 [Acidimicrobiales bacterium]